MTSRLHVHAPSAEALAGHASALSMPLWLPWPLPTDWVVAGFGWVDHGHEQLATVLSCSGPNPLGGPAEMLVVTEEPGTGLGSSFAGMDSPHPGPEVGVGAPHAHVDVDGHQVSLWCVTAAAADQAVYAGECEGRWLWLVLHPESAGALLLERLIFADVRDLGREVELLAYGDPSPRLMASE
ncbi:MAG: hypothetical protein M3P83_05385 [Actinomycetota bacterium]|nr:hypothetical protein [Actinomycetota bacterium]